MTLIAIVIALCVRSDRFIVWTRRRPVRGSRQWWTWRISGVVGRSARDRRCIGRIRRRVGDWPTQRRRPRHTGL